MQLNEQEKKFLEVMADEYEKNPSTRLEGIPARIVAAKAELYLNNPIYVVAKLKNAGFLSKLNRDRIILTKDGYNYTRPPIRRGLNLLSRHPLIVISIIVTIIAIIVTVISLSN